jgi:Protein of unknown function (DUF1566)/Bacterial Ig domain
LKVSNIFIGSMLAFGLFFSGCSGGGGSSSSSISTVTGAFIDSPVEGLDYTCSSGKIGTTNSNGEYTCNVGDTVVFKIGEVVIGSVKAQSDFITPYSLFPEDDVSALNLARLLQTIDTDNDPSNGLNIDKAKAILLPLDTDFSVNTFVAKVETALSVVLVTEDEAKSHMNDFVEHIVINNSLTSASAVQVSANDMVLEIISKPKNGNVLLNIDGSYVYTPNNNFVGNDSFSYKSGDETTKIVAISIEPKYNLLNISDRVIVDNTTKLEWQDSYPDNENNIKVTTIDEAQAYCSALTLGASNDWRLPNFQELKSIIDITKDPALNNIFKERYTTDFLGSVAMPWIHAFSNYDKTTTNDDDMWKISAISGTGTKSDGSIAIVKCVRGIELEESPHQYNRNSITSVVTDNKNYLDWQDNYNDNGGSVKQTTFYDSIGYCNNLILAGYDNWRLPTLNEMSMLIQEEKGTSKFINTVLEDNNLGGVDYSYWTSASNISGEYAWMVDMKNSLYGYGYLFGQEKIGKKDTEASVRCVRDRPNIDFTPTVINSTVSPEANSAIKDLVGTVAVSKIFADTTMEGLKTVATIVGDNSDAYKNTADILYNRSRIAFNQSSDWNSFAIKEAFRFQEEAIQSNVLAANSTQKKVFYENYTENSKLTNGMTGLSLIMGGYNAWGNMQNGNYVAAGLDGYNIGLDGITLVSSLASIKIANSSLLGKVITGTSKVNITSSLATVVMSGYTVLRDSYLQDILESYIKRYQANSDMRMFYINRLVEAYIDSTMDYVKDSEKPATDMIDLFSDVLHSYYINKNNGVTLMGDVVFKQYLNNSFILQNNYQATTINELSRAEILEIAATFTIRAMAREEDYILNKEMLNLTSMDNFKLADYIASITGDSAFDMFRKIEEVRETLFSNDVQLEIESSYKMFLAEQTLSVLYDSGKLYMDIFSNADSEIDTDGDTIPNLIDTDDDNDGMPDEWEIANGLDPLVDDSSDDTDGDGKINLLEYQDGTNPLVIDSMVGAITHNGIAYGTVTSPFTGKVWLDRNLGASQVCTALDDTACYGDYYQFGRDADGHQNKNSNVSAVQPDVISDIDHGDFISSPPDKEWTTVDGDASLRIEKWNSLDGSSICPAGFRVPNSEELYSEVTIGNTALEAFNDFLKIPLSGSRSSNGNVYGAGYDAEVWSTTTYDDSYTDFLLIHTDNIDSATNSVRSSGRVVRCIQDNTPHNTAPIANAQSVTTIQNNSVDIDLSGMDADGDTMSYQVVDSTTHGMLGIVGTNRISYTPTAGFTGIDSFTFKVNDGTVDSTVATVNITVTALSIDITHNGVTYGTVTSPYTKRKWLDRNIGANQVCTALDDSSCFGGYYYYSTSVCPTGYRVPTIDELKDETVNSRDAIRTNMEAFNGFLKIPAAGRYSTDLARVSFVGTYGMLWSSTYTTGRKKLSFSSSSIFEGYVTNSEKYSIRCINEASAQNKLPIANPLTFALVQDTYKTIVLTGSDANDDNLTYSVETEPEYGTLTGTAPNLIYTPTSNYTGDDTFSFKVNDGTVDSLISIVRISVSKKDTILHNGFSYGTVSSPYTGRVWLDRNLGAFQVCTAYNDSECYGDYYQWGRNADGHEKTTSAIASVKPTNVSDVGHGKFISTIAPPHDWTSSDGWGSQRSLNWSMTDGTSVCPVGYRVPTISELTAETLYSVDGVRNRMDAMNNFLKLPSSSSRIPHVDGTVSISFYSFTGAYYPSVTPSGVVSRTDMLRLADNYAEVVNGELSIGHPVRCIKD